MHILFIISQIRQADSFEQKVYYIVQIQMSEVTESILFRQKLYENFKDSGLLSQIKTNLRKNLMQKLQKPNLQYEQTNQKDLLQRKKPLYLRDKFLACIVKQYLFKTKKQYSLSIFMPQCNMESDEFLNFNELSEIINLNSIQVEGQSFLQSLINAWTKFRAVDICQRSTQTDYSEPLSKKLEDIEKQYRPKIDYWKLITNTTKKDNEQDPSLIVKEQRMREQFEIEKKRIRRDLQLSIKAEVQKKYESQYDFKKRQMQKAHEGRLSDLKNRQKGIIDSLQRKSKQVQQKAREVNQKELKMIKKYEDRILQLELEHKQKIKQLENKEKQMWKKQLQLKAKKKEYEDTIRLVKQKVIQQTTE